MTTTAFIGDSYTSGYLLTDPTKRWATLYSAAIGTTELNKGVPGSGYLNGGSGGASNFTQQAQSLPSGLDTVIICGGINDAGMNPTKAQVATGVQNCIAAVKTAAPTAKIIVLGAMWFHTTPSDMLLMVDSVIQTSLPADVTFIPHAMWLRLNRPEWGFYDGHPNETGHSVIANWVQDQISGVTPAGETFATFSRPGTNDASFSGTGGVNLAEGTIYNAQRGYWHLEGEAVLYGSTGGFLYLEGDGHRETIRADITGTPQPFAHEARYYHPGGDMHITVGYAPNGTATVIANGSTNITATRID